MIFVREKKKHFVISCCQRNAHNYKCKAAETTDCFMSLRVASLSKPYLYLYIVWLMCSYLALENRYRNDTSRLNMCVLLLTWRLHGPIFVLLLERRRWVCITLGGRPRGATQARFDKSIFATCNCCEKSELYEHI